MEIDGEFLTTLRDAMLKAAATVPIFPWPGPPPGMEGKPSCSRMGEHACMRQVYLNIMARLHPGDYEVLERTGDQQVPAQRGWVLESTLDHWLTSVVWVPKGIEIRIHRFDGAIIGPGAHYFGHPDGWGEVYAPGAQESLARFLLEYKHQRVMSYSSFLKQGVQATEPLYYAQAQSMLACDAVKELGITSCLFIITPFDVSAAKGSITMGKRGKNYQGELEENFRTVPDCSGVNPVFYLELVPSLPTFQRGLLAWCRTVEKYVDTNQAPPRKYNLGKDWQCDYCDMRYACELGGPCADGCEHPYCCAEGDGTAERHDGQSESI